jgi:hypothetical protein
MAEEYFNTIVATPTTESGKKIKSTVWAPTQWPMETSILENSIRVYAVAKEDTSLHLVQCMREISALTRCMVQDCSHSPTESNIGESLSMECSTEWDSFSRRMLLCKEYGREGLCSDLLRTECTHRHAEAFIDSQVHIFISYLHIVFIIYNNQVANYYHCCLIIAVDNFPYLIHYFIHTYRRVVSRYLDTDLQHISRSKNNSYLLLKQTLDI